MEEITYLDFDLLIERVGRRCRARVLNSPVGSTSSIEFPPPLTRQALESFLYRVGRPRQAVRRIDDSVTLEVKKLGGRLYRSIFKEQLRDCLVRSEQQARGRRKGLRIRLHLDSAALADLPWEYLYNEANDDFLSLKRTTPLVRFIEIDYPPTPLETTLPLRILVVIVSPSEYVALNVEDEWRKLNDALHQQIQSQAMELQRLSTPSVDQISISTYDQLHRTLSRGEYHVLHFIGHGGFRESSDEGILLFENEEGETHPVSGNLLGMLLQDHPSLRLVVLNACEGARGSTRDPFSGTAQSLIRKGIPAVVAMQFEITDKAAIRFSRIFYEHVAANYPIDAAVTEARKSIRGSGNLFEWGTPVLHLLAPDGRIFQLSPNQEGKTREKPPEDPPKSARAKSTRKKSTPPKSTRAKSTRKKSTPPKSTRAKSTRKKSTPPKSTRAKSTRKKSTPRKGVKAPRSKVTGRIFGNRYRVVGLLGTGGMARVYRARDRLLGREVALKVLSERLSSDLSFVERFRREAQNAGRLYHPNIVALYDYGEEDNRYFIVMELIEGRSLSDLIEHEGPLMPERAAEIASDVADALDRAHTLGLVHRDIKSSNIMITATGETKVTDFGIARALGKGDQTITGMVVGTASYLAPEQAQGDRVDARSDVYSLGVVLFEMLTGRTPFRGDTPASIAYKHVREKSPAPSSANRGVPAAFDAVTLKALAKDPNNRYQSAADMRRDLDGILTKEVPPSGRPGRRSFFGNRRS
jgi:hypothetical protein